MIRFELDGKRYAVRWRYPDKNKMSNPRVHPRTSCLWLQPHAAPDVSWMIYHSVTIRCYRKTDAWDKEVGRCESLRQLLASVMVQGRYLTTAQRRIVWDAYLNRRRGSNGNPSEARVA